MPTIISRSGITWTLAGDHVHGTYMNGDPWVVGPVSVTAISPASTVIGGRTVHGTEKNMQDRRRAVSWDDFSQGFDSLPSCHYDDALNVGKAASLPIALVAGDSIVSVQSDTQATSSFFPSVVDRAAVLTVVAAPPAANEFRPPYWYPDRPAQPYVWNDAFLDKLTDEFDASWGANINALAERASALWLTCGNNEASFRVMPKLQMPFYYTDRNAELGNMFLALNSAIPKTQKRALAIAMCQIGIDLAWSVKNGQYWASRHATGRKPQIVFMSWMLEHADFADVNALCRDDLEVSGPSTKMQTHEVVWGEDGQTFEVSVTDAGPPEVINFGRGNYTPADLGKADWGNDHFMQDGLGDNSDWWSQDFNGNYRRCCSGSGWFAMWLAFQAMGLRKLWDHDPWFDYNFRWQTYGRQIGFVGDTLAEDTSWLPLWTTHRPFEDSTSGRIVGLRGPGRPKLKMLTHADNLRPWLCQVEVGTVAPAVGLLVRSSATTKFPKKSFFGVQTNGLVFVDEAGFQGFLPIAADNQGIAVVPMQPVDDPGQTYTIQAVFLINGQLVTTNALEVTVLEGAVS